MPTPKILALDTGEDASAKDDTTTYAASVKTRAYLPSGQLAVLGLVRESVLVAKSRSGVTLQLTVHRDFNIQRQTATVTLTPAASEPRVIKKFQGSAMADMAAVQFTIGDAAAVASSWSLDRLHVMESNEGET